MKNKMILADDQIWDFLSKDNLIRRIHEKKSIFENVMAILLKDMPSKGVILPVLAFEKNSDERLCKTKKMSK